MRVPRNMTQYNIPDEQMQDILARIKNSTDYQKYVKKRAEHIRRGEMAQAMRVAKMMEQLEQRSIKYYIQSYYRHKEKVNDLLAVMPDKDQDMMAAYGDAIVMLSDVLETLIVETNQLLNKYHPEFQIEMFDKLAELSNEAKKQVRMLDTQSYSDAYMSLYGITTDKLTNMVINQAKSFVSKVKSNAERLINKAS